MSENTNMSCVVCGKSQRLIPVGIVKYLASQNNLSAVLVSVLNKVSPETLVLDKAQICNFCNGRCERYDRLDQQIQSIKDTILEDYTRNIYKLQPVPSIEIPFKKIRLQAPPSAESISDVFPDSKGNEDALETNSSALYTSERTHYLPVISNVTSLVMPTSVSAHHGSNASNSYFSNIDVDVTDNKVTSIHDRFSSLRDCSVVLERLSKHTISGRLQNSTRCLVEKDSCRDISRYVQIVKNADLRDVSPLRIENQEMALTLASSEKQGRRHRCYTCNVTFESFGILQLHRQQEHERIKYSCRLCKEEFRSQIMVSDHEAQHWKRIKTIAKEHMQLSDTGVQTDASLEVENSSKRNEAGSTVNQSVTLDVTPGATIRADCEISEDDNQLEVPAQKCIFCDKEFAGKCERKTHLIEFHKEDILMSVLSDPNYGTNLYLKTNRKKQLDMLIVHNDAETNKGYVVPEIEDIYPNNNENALEDYSQTQDLPNKTVSNKKRDQVNSRKNLLHSKDVTENVLPNEDESRQRQNHTRKVQLDRSSTGNVTHSQDKVTPKKSKPKNLNNSLSMEPQSLNLKQTVKSVHKTKDSFVDNSDIDAETEYSLHNRIKEENFQKRKEHDKPNQAQMKQFNKRNFYVQEKRKRLKHIQAKIRGKSLKPALKLDDSRESSKEYYDGECSSVTNLQGNNTQSRRKLDSESEDNEVDSKINNNSEYEYTEEIKRFDPNRLSNTSKQNCTSRNLLEAHHSNRNVLQFRNRDLFDVPKGRKRQSNKIKSEIKKYAMEVSRKDNSFVDDDNNDAISDRDIKMFLKESKHSKFNTVGPKKRSHANRPLDSYKYDSNKYNKFSHFLKQTNLAKAQRRLRHKIKHENDYFANESKESDNCYLDKVMSPIKDYSVEEEQNKFSDASNDDESETRALDNWDKSMVTDKEDVPDDTEYKQEVASLVHRAENIKAKSDLDRIPCELCFATFPSRASYRVHMANYHPGQRYMCKFCGLRFWNWSILVNHRRTCQIFQCDVCSMTFKTKGRILRHLFVHSVKKRYQCGECDCSFTERRCLIDHKVAANHLTPIKFKGPDIRYNVEENNAEMLDKKVKRIKHQHYKCPICGVPNVHKTHLLMHMKHSHCMSNRVKKLTVKTQNSVIKGPSDKVDSVKLLHKLLNFNEESNDRKTLEQVIQMRKNEVQEEKPFDSVEDELQSNSDVKAQKRIPCELCLLTFPSRPALRGHLTNIHPRERYKCNFCGLRFPQISVLVKHRRICQIYQCDVCSRSFHEKALLVRHLFVHSVKKRYQCSLCSSSYTERKLLLRHQARASHHGPITFHGPDMGKAYRHNKNPGERRKFDNPRELLLATSGRYYECPICGVTDSLKINILGHMKEMNHRANQIIVHERPTEPIIKIKPNKPKEDDAKNLLEKLLRNTRESIDIRKVQGTRLDDEDDSSSCVIDGIRFASRAEATRAWFRASGKKPFECSKCGAGYFTKLSLLAHMENMDHISDSIIENVPTFDEIGKVYSNVASVKEDLESKNIAGDADINDFIKMNATVKELQIQSPSDDDRPREVLSRVIIPSDQDFSQPIQVFDQNGVASEQTYYLQAGDGRVIWDMADLEENDIHLYVSEDGTIVTRDKDGVSVQLMQVEVPYEGVSEVIVDNKSGVLQ